MTALNLIDVVIAVANRTPSRAAFLGDDGAMSYAQLVERSALCARYLARNGVEAGGRVAIAFPRPVDNIIVLLAAWMLGATPVVLDFRMKRAERASVAEAFRLSAFVMARAGAADARHLEISIGDLAEATAGEATEIPERPDTDNPALIFRTSGTTGTPQGAVFSHAALLHMHWAKSLGEMGFDRGLFVHATPLYYTAGLERTLSQLFDGGTSQLLPPITGVDELAERLVSSKASVCFMVPPQLSAMLELSSGRPTPMFPGLRLVSGGANISVEACLRAREALTPDIAITYGTSLCGAITTLHGEDLPEKAGSVGQPYKTNRVEIFDDEDAPCPRGAAGRIKVRSAGNAHMMEGAVPGASERIAGGWVETGDIGYLDEDGFLFLAGRSSDVIIRKGVNVFPREIEAVLDGHERVVEAAVVGVPDPVAGEEIAAFVVTRDGVAEKDLHSFVRGRLVADKRPAIIRVVDALPRSPAGKVLKRLLVEQAVAERE